MGYFAPAHLWQRKSLREWPPAGRWIVDLRHPLARDLRAHWMFLNGSLVDLTPPRLSVVLVGTANLGVGQGGYGVEALTTSTDAASIACPAGSPLNLVDATLEGCGFYVAAGGGNAWRPFIGRRRDGNSAASSCWVLGPRSTGLAGIGITWGAAVANQTVSGATALTALRTNLIHGCWDASVVKIYLDGIEDGSAARSNATAVDYSGNQPAYIGWTGSVHASFSGNNDGRAFFASAWGRRLSAEEILWRQREPWDWLREETPRSYFFATAAGGAATAPLFRHGSLSGLGSGGPLFHNPLN